MWLQLLHSHVGPKNLFRGCQEMGQDDDNEEGNNDTLIVNNNSESV